MPLPSFITNIADKAQNAIKDSPLSQHLPSSITGGGTTTTDGGGTKNVTMGQIQYQFRQLQQTYSTTTPVQKIITAERGVILDFESLARDTQGQSKELYTWGQTLQPDVKDVSDRLAFLNYVSGSLSSTLAAELNAARTPLKALRDDEVALTQKRNVRAAIHTQIARLEHSQEKGNEKHIVELKAQLAKLEKDDEPAETAYKILLRKNLKESEQKKFQALREYGEKIALLSQAADAVLAVLPSVPPSPDQPYAGAEETGNIRASLQHSLDQWKPGQATLSAPERANLNRTHTQSFGVTHSEELQKITTTEPPSVPASPPLGGSSEPGRDSSLDAKPSSVPEPAPVSTEDLGATTPSATSSAVPPEPVPTQDLNSTPVPSTTPAPINPAVGGKEPAPFLSTAPSVVVASPGPIGTDSKVPAVTPTVAETGESSSGAAPVPERYESAEVEKKRLEREEREKLLHRQTSEYAEGDTPPPYDADI